MAPGRPGPGLSESREAAPDPAGSTQASGPAAAPVRGFGPWRKRGPGSGPRPRSATLPQRPHVTGELGPVPGDSKPFGTRQALHSRPGLARAGPASGRARIRELAPGFGLLHLLSCSSLRFKAIRFATAIRFGFSAIRKARAG